MAAAWAVVVVAAVLMVEFGRGGGGVVIRPLVASWARASRFAAGISARGLAFGFGAGVPVRTMLVLLLLFDPQPPPQPPEEPQPPEAEQPPPEDEPHPEPQPPCCGPGTGPFVDLLTYTGAALESAVTGGGRCVVTTALKTSTPR
jgi:hypothetical protein